MKHRLFALIIAITLAATLCACGSDQTTPAPTYDETPSASIGANGEPNIAAPDTSEPIITTDDPSNPNTSDVSSTIEQPDPPILKPQGLIIMTVEVPTGATRTLTITSINLNTGDVQTISEFQFGNQPAGSSDRGIYEAPGGGVIGEGYYATRREWFSETYDKMAITRVDGLNNDSHAGWLDTNNEFFDVTVALGLQTQSDFDAPARHEAVGFSDDDQFVYRTLVGEGGSAYWEYYHVSCSSVLPDCVEAGTGFPGEAEGIDSVKIRISDWASSGAYLTNEQNKVSLLHDASGDVISYVPGTSRLSWNGVFSPDESQIAFMSNPKNGGVVDIYVMPIAGGDPTKVNAPFTLASQLECKTGYYSGGAPCSMLIDWK